MFRVVNRTPDGALELGGIAFAGARGVSNVKVRVDDEAWREAKIRRPLSDLSWVIWRAAFSLLAQHTVNCAYFGFFLPPAELNVLMTGSSSPAVIKPSPIRAANSDIFSPPAAT